MSQNRTPAGVPTGGRFATASRGEADVLLSEPPVLDINEQFAKDHRNLTAEATAHLLLAPARRMNRVQAERHVRALIDDAAEDGDPQRIDGIASLASGRGWAGVAYVRRYPGAGNPECPSSDYLPTKAAATRTAEYALARTVDAERRAQEATSHGTRLDPESGR